MPLAPFLILLGEQTRGRGAGGGGGGAHASSFKHASLNRHHAVPE